MQKRGLILGGYNTALEGWTLTGWKLTPAEQKTNFLEKQAGDGSWDLSTALTDGIPRYKTRTLTATFECSEGSRQTREDEIRNMVNTLDGMRESIKLPDDETHYIVGRIHVAREYNDLAHAAVTVTAICEPWKYSNTETSVAITATDAKQTVRLVNKGRRAVVPTLTVPGTGASVLIEYGTASIALGPGTYQWPSLLLTNGVHDIKVSGTGSLIVAFREAVLE